MPRLNDTTTYPNTTPALTDHVPGTDVSDTTNHAGGETVTFTLQAIMDLYEANFAAPADFIDAITEIASGLKSGSDATLITGTAGTSGNIGQWDANGDLIDMTAAQARTLLNVENGATADQTDAEIETAYNNQVSTVSQAEAEAGTSTTVRRWTAQRVSQAIAALAAADNFDTGAGAPASAPSAVNRFYRDTTNGTLYFSIGTSTTADWIELFNENGGSLLSDLTLTTTIVGADYALFEDATDNSIQARTWTNLISDLGLLQNVVEDTTPQLGGQLDVNGNALGDGTLELLAFSETVSAVNHVQIANAATTNGPTISAVGDDTNVDLNLAGKGTGNITIGNFTFDADQTVGAGQDNYVLTYDNGTGLVSLEASAGGGGGADDPLFVGHAGNSIPSNTNPATLDTVGDTNSNPIMVLDFDGSAANESAIWQFVMPNGYASGGLTFEIHYATSGTSGNDVQFEVSAHKIVAGDTLTTEDFGTATDITDTPSTTANVVDVSPTGAVTHANCGSPAGGDVMRIRVTRDYDHAANTDDVQLLSVIVTET